MDDDLEDSFWSLLSMTITWRRGSPIRLTTERPPRKREFSGNSEVAGRIGKGRVPRPRASPKPYEGAAAHRRIGLNRQRRDVGRGDPLRRTRGVRQASLPIPPGEQGALYLNRIQLEEFAKSVEREDGFLSRGFDPLNRF
jgi:hypothetical protein